MLFLPSLFLSRNCGRHFTCRNWSKFKPSRRTTQMINSKDEEWQKERKEIVIADVFFIWFLIVVCFKSFLSFLESFLSFSATTRIIVMISFTRLWDIECPHQCAPAFRLARHSQSGKVPMWSCHVTIISRLPLCPSLSLSVPLCPSQRRKKKSKFSTLIIDWTGWPRDWRRPTQGTVGIASAARRTRRLGHLHVPCRQPARIDECLFYHSSHRWVGPGSWTQLFGQTASVTGRNSIENTCSLSLADGHRVDLRPALIQPNQ